VSVLAVLLYPHDWGLVVVDLCWWDLLVGYWRWLIQVGDRGRLVGIADWRWLIVDFRRLWSKTLHGLEASVSKRRFRHNVV
jgi:hypothetical protein